MTALAPITPADLAAILSTDARTTRKFLRSITPQDEQPGKGSRWQIEKRDVRSLKTKFTKFLEEHTRKADEAAEDLHTEELVEADEVTTDA